MDFVNEIRNKWICAVTMVRIHYLLIACDGHTHRTQALAHTGKTDVEFHFFIPLANRILFVVVLCAHSVWFAYYHPIQQSCLLDSILYAMQTCNKFAVNGNPFCNKLVCVVLLRNDIQYVRIYIRLEIWWMRVCLCACSENRKPTAMQHTR